MNATAYYEMLKARARELRQEREWTQPRIGLREIKQLCLEKGIEKIDLWPPAKCRTAKKRTKVRGIYAPNGGRPCVMVNRHLPKEQRVFTIGHELKHHLFDVDGDAPMLCETKVQNNAIEIGAEIFAAELIYPDADFCRDLGDRGVKPGACTAEDLVRLKHDTGTSLSCAALAKKAYRFNFAAKDTFEKAPWKKIELQIFGEPDYLRFRRRRTPQR
jgi:Zn-dependent peptidase ImmA (M78 family)